MTRIIAFVRIIWTKLIRYALKFGVIGLAGYVIDVAIFNLLRLGILANGTFLQGPLAAKVVSVSIATLASWFGNRYWTFREHRRKNYLLELLEFTGVAVGGLAIGLLCLWISHYVLGFQSLIADNISTNVIGLVLGTSFRFILYRFWVYGHRRSDGLALRQSQAEAAAIALFEDDQIDSESAAKA